MLLKRVPELDEVLAASSQDDPMRFYLDRAQRLPHRNFYPVQGGLLGFCDAAEQCLRELGVAIHTGEEIVELAVSSAPAEVRMRSGLDIRADRIVWAAGVEALAQYAGCGDQITALIHRVPMVYFYFAVERGQAGELTYVQDFDSDHLLFRASVPAVANDTNCRPGQTYICCEVPLGRDSPGWQEPATIRDRVWGEVRHSGITTAREPLAEVSFQVPASYRLPKPEYFDTVSSLLDDWFSNERFIGVQPWTFSKNDILADLIALVDSYV